MKQKVLEKKSNYKAFFLIVLLVVVLSFCVFIGSVLAWLQIEEDAGSTGQLVVGSVDFEIYNGNTKITSDKSNYNGVTLAGSNEMTIASGTSNRSVNLKIRNTGTISAIMRVTMSIYYKNAENENVYVKIVNKAQSELSDNEILLQNDTWVNDFKDDVTVGYSYYNDQIEPYTISTIDPSTGNVVSQEVSSNAVSVVTLISVPTSQINTVYYISLQVDGVAYSGNIYSEMVKPEANRDVAEEAYPFGVPAGLPASWTAWQ